MSCYTGSLFFLKKKVQQTTGKTAVASPADIHRYLVARKLISTLGQFECQKYCTRVTNLSVELNDLFRFE